MFLFGLRPGDTVLVWPVASPVVFLVSTWVVPLLLLFGAGETLLGYLFREHLVSELTIFSYAHSWLESV